MYEAKSMCNGGGRARAPLAHGLARHRSGLRYLGQLRNSLVSTSETRSDILAAGLLRRPLPRSRSPGPCLQMPFASALAHPSTAAPEQSEEFYNVNLQYFSIIRLTRKNKADKI